MIHERTESDSRENDLRFSTEIDKNVNPILDVDINGSIIYRNAAATDVLNSNGLKDPGVFLPEEIPQHMWESKEPLPVNYEKTIGKSIFFYHSVQFQIPKEQEYTLLMLRKKSCERGSDLK